MLVEEGLLLSFFSIVKRDTKGDTLGSQAGGLQAISRWWSGNAPPPVQIRRKIATLEGVAAEPASMHQHQSK
jgi:hypothetical protein